MSDKIKMLEIWEEACGRLENVVDEYPYIRLDFGKFQIRLGSIESMGVSETQLKRLIGKKICIIRTDIPDKPILWRYH